MTSTSSHCPQLHSSPNAGQAHSTIVPKLSLAFSILSVMPSTRCQHALLTSFTSLPSVSLDQCQKNKIKPNTSLSVRTDPNQWYIIVIEKGVQCGLNSTPILTEMTVLEGEWEKMWSSSEQGFNRVKELKNYKKVERGVGPYEPIWIC